MTYRLGDTLGFQVPNNFMAFNIDSPPSWETVSADNRLSGRASQGFQVRSEHGYTLHQCPLQPHLEHRGKRIGKGESARAGANKDMGLNPSRISPDGRGSRTYGIYRERLSVQMMRTPLHSQLTVRVGRRQCPDRYGLTDGAAAGGAAAAGAVEGTSFLPRSNIF